MHLLNFGSLLYVRWRIQVFCGRISCFEWNDTNLLCQACHHHHTIDSRLAFTLFWCSSSWKKKQARNTCSRRDHWLFSPVIDSPTVGNIFRRYSLANVNEWWDFSVCVVWYSFIHALFIFWFVPCISATRFFNRSRMHSEVGLRFEMVQPLWSYVIPINFPIMRCHLMSFKIFVKL